MEWVEHDGVEEGQLPDWARADGEPLPEELGRAVKAGLVMHAEKKSRWIAVQWEHVLAIARATDRAYVLVPRRPPAPPWIEVSLTAAEHLEEISDARRQQRQGLRGAPLPPRQRLAPEEILAHVMARHDVPGAIEVPLRIERFSWLMAGAGSAPPAGIAGFYSLAFLHTLGSLALPIAGGIALAAGVGLVASAYGTDRVRRSRKKRRRALVMTPDAYVGGLDGFGIRAIPWDSIVGFRAGTILDRTPQSMWRGGGTKDVPQPALEVVGASDQVVARVAARWFDIDLPVLVALATAYRERAMAE